MASQPEEYYYLGRNTGASVRLHIQHYLWKQQLGYLLHPQVYVAKDTETKVLDVACGTGYVLHLEKPRIWLIDLAKEMPNATLDGLDISSAQFPYENWLPAKVSLGELIVFQDVPPELVGKYDVVHIGLIVAAIRNQQELSILIERLLVFLKPRGYLQWNEANPNDITYKAAAPEVTGTNVETLFKCIRDALGARNGFDAGWVRKLGSILGAHPDVEEVLADEFHTVADELAVPASFVSLSTAQEIVSKLPQKMVEDLGIQGLFEKAGIEFQEGMSVRLNQVVVVARKRV